MISDTATISHMGNLEATLPSGDRIEENLRRIDERTWLYHLPDGMADFTKLRIKVPGNVQGDPYLFAHSVAEDFSTSAARWNRANISPGLQSPEKEGHRWTIADPPPKSKFRALIDRIWSILMKVPLFHMLVDDDVVEPNFQVLETEEVPVLDEGDVSLLDVKREMVLPPVPCLLRKEDRLAERTFHDPFTILATQAFKTVEEFFVMEAEHRGSHRLVLRDDLLLLEKIIEPEEGDETHEGENRVTVTAFRNFLLLEYGATFVSRLEEGYGLSLSQMIERGDPLLSDHVSKANIVMNNIEKADIERIYEDLYKISEYINAEQISPDQLASSCLLALVDANVPYSLPMREIRGLLRVLPKDKRTVADLQAFIGDEKLSSVRALSPEKFNDIVDIIMPNDEEREASLTGRGIHHTPIVGWNTMGDLNVPNPFRDFFELEQLFGTLQQSAKFSEKGEDWEGYYEILSHVVVKKNLFRVSSIHAAVKDWHAGLLIPAPNAFDGTKRWYYNDSFIDDGQGDVHYSFLAVSRDAVDGNERLLPMINVHRSTNVNSNAVNWQDSIAADLNPYGAPGSLDPARVDPYERDPFQLRTIPIWEAYFQDYVNFEEESSLNEAARAFIQYVRVCHSEDVQTVCASVENCLKTKDREQLVQLLHEYGALYEESVHSLQKRCQDIVFVGHSLGGALAQFRMAFFTSRVDRVPLPGAKYSCYAFDSPATDNHVNAKFVDFGRRHRAVLKRSKIKWKIYLRFERGDPVPQAGGSHLGARSRIRTEDKDWLSFSAKAFSPLATAEDPSVVLLPTHGRRFTRAEVNKDYSVTDLTAETVFRFDHSLWLHGHMGEIFGCLVFRSPVLDEMLRRFCGLLYTFKHRKLKSEYGNKIGYRRGDNVFAILEGDAAEL